MATYVIGDVQGCFQALQALLEKIAFNPEQDTLWFTGDLVNRGENSLGVLRFVKSLGSRAITVLGNHDLSLLARAEGFGKAHASDTIQDVLAAPDRDELLTWLRQQPLCHFDKKRQLLLVHAGVLPQWSAKKTCKLAKEVEKALRHPTHYREVLANMFGNKPKRWKPELEGYERFRLIISALTRLRVCDEKGKMDFDFKSTYDQIPDGLFAWFDIPKRRSQAVEIIFGHWAALGLFQKKNIIGLDSGCFWGNALTALRLEDRQIFQVPGTTLRPAAFSD